MSVISPQVILDLMDEIDAEDPVDFGDLPVDESAARTLVASHLAQMHERLVAEDVTCEAREALLLATASRVILENLLLHVRVLTTGAGDTSGEIQALFARLGIAPHR